ncbi:hypothetical protein OHB00_20165 [Streptomyces sp. NBC_00631]|uniref:hypothetical protein n=1 Tax=Streptomyces sp. NBC_00631 TaxID=2975793 RepID=UPI0030DF86C0
MFSGVHTGAGPVAGVLTGAYDADALRAAGASRTPAPVAGLPGVLAGRPTSR